MKRLIAIVTFLMTVCAANDPILRDQITLISRTRSGSNWYQYCIKQLVKKPVHFVQSHYKLNPCRGVKGFYWSHDPKIEKLFPSKHNKLIITLRNYKELFCRDTRDLQGEEKYTALFNPKLYIQYVEFIKAFDAWQKETRHLYYYEDMMDHPEGTLRGILTFVGESAGSLPHFIKSLAVHKKRSIILYNQRFKYSITEGKANLYHSLNVPSEILLKVDAMMREYAGPLFDKYLKRYEHRPTAEI